MAGPPLRVQPPPTSLLGLPARSWWLEPVDRETWYRESEREAERMRQSKEAMRGAVSNAALIDSKDNW